jgi:hypothetical protein
MASSVRTVTKALAAEEDLLFGEGTAQQTRAGRSYTVSKVRGFRPVNNQSELDDLDFNKFPKAVLVENGNFKLYQHNGTFYEELVLVNKTLVVATPSTSISAIANNTIIFSVGSAHTVTNFDNGIKGQELNVISTTANTTIANNANIVLKGGSNYLIPTHTGLRLVYTGTVWAEV